MVQRVPKRHFAAPESFVVMSYRGIGERAVVAIKKRMGAEQHFRKGREDKQAEQQGKALGREPSLSVSSVHSGVQASCAGRAAVDDLDWQKPINVAARLRQEINAPTRKK